MNPGDKVAFKGPYGTEQGTVVSVNGDTVKVRSATGQVHTVPATNVISLSNAKSLRPVNRLSK